MGSIAQGVRRKARAHGLGCWAWGSGLGAQGSGNGTPGSGPLTIYYMCTNYMSYMIYYSSSSYYCYYLHACLTIPPWRPVASAAPAWGQGAAQARRLPPRGRGSPCAPSPAIIISIAIIIIVIISLLLYYTILLLYLLL